MPKGRSPLLLALAIALLIAAAGTAVAVIRSGSKPAAVAPSPSPSAQPAPQPTLPSHSPPPAVFTDAPPPAGVDVIWLSRYWEQVDGSLRLHAVDWGGHEVGRLTLPCAGRCSAQQSPDGSRLLLALPGSGYRLVDSDGHDLGVPPLLGVAPSWADDSRHLCVVDGVTTPPSPGATVRATLRVFDAASGQSSAATHVAGTAWFDDQWVVRSCSLGADRAVIALQSGGAISTVRVVQLSTGTTLYARDDPPPTPGPVCSACHVGAFAATHDGRLALEELNSGDLQLRDLSTGLVGPWNPPAPHATQPLALSWGGRLAITSQGVVDVAAESIIWRVPDSILQVAVRPGGDDVVLVLSGSPGADNMMRIVHLDGSDIALDGSGLT